MHMCVCVYVYVYVLYACIHFCLDGDLVFFQLIMIVNDAAVNICVHAVNMCVCVPHCEQCKRFFSINKEKLSSWDL